MAVKKDELLKAAEKLARKLIEIDAHPSYRAVWEIGNQHGFRYSGPNYEKELLALRKVLGL